MRNEKGLIQVIVIIILLVGIGATVYLSQKTQVFKSRANLEQQACQEGVDDFSLGEGCTTGGSNIITIGQKEGVRSSEAWDEFTTSDARASYQVGQQGLAGMRDWIGHSDCESCGRGTPKSQTLIINTPVRGEYQLTIYPAFISAEDTYMASLSMPSDRSQNDLISRNDLISSGATKRYPARLYNVSEEDKWVIRFTSAGATSHITLYNQATSDSHYLYFDAMELQSPPTEQRAGYRNATYECYDGVAGSVGSEGTCETVEGLRSLAERACVGHRKCYGGGSQGSGQPSQQQPSADQVITNSLNNSTPTPPTAPLSITGHVFIDTNRNGIFDIGEQLWTDRNNPLNVVIFTGESNIVKQVAVNEFGKFSLDGIPDGEYKMGINFTSAMLSSGYTLYNNRNNFPIRLPALSGELKFAIQPPGEQTLNQGQQ